MAINKKLHAEIFEMKYKGFLDELKNVSKWRDYSENIVMKRVSEQINLPEDAIHNHISNILVNMDGKKDLALLIRNAEYELNSTLVESEIKKCINFMNNFADHGYLAVIKRPEITENDIVSALSELGIKRNDLLLIHSSTSNCGYIRNGAKTVISAIKKAVGESGTVLFPTFTRPYIYLGGHNLDANCHPYDACDISQICTGNVPQTLFAEFPEAIRSKHISHSWGGFGLLATECLNAHGESEPPASVNSPMGKALEHGGKVFHFGSSIATTTFVHFLEDYCDMPFLDTAICRMKMPDGSVKTVAIEKHLPGHRDYYCGFEAENCKFYSAAKGAGLKINTEKLGLGELKLMDIKELFDIGVKLLRTDSRILLCDNPECIFCKNKKQIKDLN